jgi:hypothetical protein
VTVPGAAFFYVPERSRSLVEQVDRLATLLGRPLDPEQRAAVEVLTGSRPDGRASALVSVLICPRQNMKTWLFMLIVLARLLEPGGDRFIVWSAHLFDTAQETFKDFCDLIESHSWLDDLVTKIDRGNGEECITFAGGRRLRFRARAKTGGRGLSGDCVVLDEGFALQALHMGALIPILSTRHRALVLIGSSAGLFDSAILRGFRDRGRRGGRGAPAYVEFCAPGSFADPGCTDQECGHDPGTPGCVLDDEELWLRSNPAARAGRISLEYLREERGALPWREFARERLGWWDEPSGDSPITVASWEARTDPGSKPLRRPVALALDTSKGLRGAAVVAAGRRADGRLHAEVLRADPGTAWLPEFLRTKTRELGGCPVFVLGGSATAQAVVPDLSGIRIEDVSAADYAAACVALEGDVEADRVRHLGDQLLTDALAAAATKKVGDTGAWIWSPRQSSDDIHPLVAMTLALWAIREGRGYDPLKSFG